MRKIREGDLEKFNAVCEKYKDYFRRDRNYTLILRLRHNVIKFGLRKINQSYSNISFEDITRKLGLEKN